ncbi:MAG: HAMP domain-containing histidine kinase [Actinomycetia bacterium]|nr:HAMP domain-containing histidine kinase [Actinomycetes bacterium]
MPDRDSVATGSARVAVGPTAIPPPRHWRFLPRTIASRLVVSVVALVLVLVVVIGSVTYFALRNFLMNRLDEQLTATIRQAATRVGTGPDYLGSQPIWITALDSNGNVLGITVASGVEPMALSAEDRARLTQEIGQATTVRTTDGHTLRVLSVAVTARPGMRQGVLLIGLSTDSVERTVHQLFLLEVGIGAGAVLISFLVTAYGVRWPMRPLYRVTRTAQEVSAELSPDGAGLDRRVPVSGSEADTEAGQLAESVNTLLAVVETQFAARLASEERMRQFLADASHELRTPLTSIRGYAELSRMRRATGRPLTDGDLNDADTLARIEHEGTRMSRLVEDLLLLARSDQGMAPQREPIDVSELVDDAVEGSLAVHPDRRIDVVVPAPLTVFGDRDQLLRVVRNLITNATVHTRSDGPIRVSAVAERAGAERAGAERAADGATIVLRVDDCGPGLPPEQVAHVFERFWRADKARSRARGGSGLGLPIVASIVAAHGGTVAFDSAVETGSTVTVRLPANPPAVGP